MACLFLSAFHYSPLARFSLLLPRPPTPTLFPYTTLFRSHSAAQTRSPHSAPAAHAAAEARCPPLPGTDRKSTRLNSSHVAISYAVFCLKKKNDYKHENEYKPENNDAYEHHGPRYLRTQYD